MPQKTPEFPQRPSGPARRGGQLSYPLRSPGRLSPSGRRAGAGPAAAQKPPLAVSRAEKASLRRLSEGERGRQGRGVPGGRSGLPAVRRPASPGCRGAGLRRAVTAVTGAGLGNGRSARLEEIPESHPKIPTGNEVCRVMTVSRD